MSHCILVHGHNGGFRCLHSAGTMPDSSPVQDISARAHTAAGSVGYCVETVSDGAWVSILQVRKDPEDGMREGYIAFSIFVPNHNRVERMREALDRVLATYDQMTARTRTVEIPESWTFIDKLSEVLPYSESQQVPTQPEEGRLPAARYYLPNSDIKSLLQDVFVPAFSGYERVFIIPQEVAGTESDPLASILGERLDSTPDISEEVRTGQRSYRIRWTNEPAYAIANRNEIPATVPAKEAIGKKITIQRPYHEPIDITIEASDVDEKLRSINLRYPESDEFTKQEKAVSISVPGVTRYRGRIRAKENKELSITEDELSNVTFEGDEIGQKYILTITSDKYAEYSVEFIPEKTSQLVCRLASGSPAVNNKNFDFIEINFTLGKRSHVSPGNADFTCEAEGLFYNDLNHSIAYPKGMKLKGIKFSLTFERNYRAYHGTFDGQSTMKIPLTYRTSGLFVRYRSLAIIIAIALVIIIGAALWKNSGSKALTTNPDANTPMVTAVDDANKQGTADSATDVKETAAAQPQAKAEEAPPAETAPAVPVNESDRRFIKAIPDRGSLKCIVTRIDEKKEPCTPEQEKLLKELYNLVWNNTKGKYDTWFPANKDCPNLEVFVNKYKKDNNLQ